VTGPLFTGVALALAGAACFGTGQAWRKRRAERGTGIADRAVAGALSLLRDRRWLLASGLVAAGWAFDAAALAVAPTSLVLPCNTVALVVVAAGSSRWLHERLRRRERAGVLACVVGAGCAALSAGGSDPTASTAPAALAIAVAGAVALAATAWRAARSRPLAAATLRAAAAGTLFGGSALLTRAVGLAATSSSPARWAWPLAALLPCAALATIFQQAAFQCGRGVVVVAWTLVLGDFAPALVAPSVFGERWPEGAEGTWRALSWAAFLAGLALLGAAAARTDPSRGNGRDGRSGSRRPTPSARGASLAEREP
jgi:hypothetical protein